jgi:hemoglobin
METTSSQSLYERIGGEKTLAAMIPAFYERVLADADLAPFFQAVSMEKLHGMQQEFFAMATGGPVQYSGRPLAHVHHGKGITKAHFAAFTGHLVDTLATMNLPQADLDEVIARVNATANEITGTSY